jgi:hypothetical protein
VGEDEEKKGEKGEGFLRPHTKFTIRRHAGGAVNKGGAHDMQMQAGPTIEVERSLGGLQLWHWLFALL